MSAADLFAIATQADDFYSVLFDAIPSPTFVLDEDFGVIDFNVAAATLAEKVPDTPLRSRPGEFMHCVQTADGSRCGTTPECALCAMRHGVNEARDGQRVQRRLHRTNLVSRDGCTREVSFLITASAFRDRDHSLTVLCMEDVTELATLRQLLSATTTTQPCAVAASA